MNLIGKGTIDKGEGYFKYLLCVLYEKTFSSVPYCTINSNRYANSGMNFMSDKSQVGLKEANTFFITW